MQRYLCVRDFQSTHDTTVRYDDARKVAARQNCSGYVARIRLPWQFRRANLCIPTDINGIIIMHIYYAGRKHWKNLI